MKIILLCIIITKNTYIFRDFREGKGLNKICEFYLCSVEARGATAPAFSS
jgi:hypothetical protein